MNQTKLKALFDTLETRPPSSEAENRAILAGIEAFRAEGQKSSPRPRPMFDALKKLGVRINIWEWIMDHRLSLGTAAACFLAVPIGVSVFYANGYDQGLMRFYSGSDRNPILSGREPEGKQRHHEILDEVRRSEEQFGRLEPNRQRAGELVAPVAEPKTALVDSGKEIRSSGAGSREAAGNEKVRSDDAAPEPAGKTERATKIEQAREIEQARKAEPVSRLKKSDSAVRLKVTKPQTPALVQGLISARTTGASEAEMDVATRPAPEAPVPLSLQQPADKRFEAIESNPLKIVADHPVSTFSIDVDTASYARVRRNLKQGVFPAPADVRVEEMINYFSYDYALPDSLETPFKPSVSLYPTPWNKDTKLLHIGIKGADIVPAARPRANLVFLIDTSGSMNGPDRLPLLQTAFRLLVQELDENDTVSIVTYAGNAGTVLQPTRAGNRREIINAITNLRSGGSTAGAAGIRQAYALAEQAFDKNGVNRVILATDGDFNVGMTDHEQLKGYIADKRKSGVFLSVLGFGQGNYKDGLMQILAQNGNGNAAYIDSLKEAEKVLVTEATSTLFPIAKDVKIQIEFNPLTVSAYRLIGYETRMLRRQDFNNDRIDAGDIGSGHTVTALYEITPVNSAYKPVDDLRYQQSEKADLTRSSDEYAFLKLRYKKPDGVESRLIEQPITTTIEHVSIDPLSNDVRFAAAVAAFGQKLRGNSHVRTMTYAQIHDLAKSARGEDRFGIRSEFLDLVRMAKLLMPMEMEKSAEDRR